MSQGEGGGRPPVYTAEKRAEIAAALLEWSKHDDSFFLAEFCSDHELWVQRLSELAKEDEKFSEALKAAKNRCEMRLARKTADGKTPTAFGIFALKQHQWTDKTETEITGANGGPLDLSVRVNWAESK